MSTIIRIVQKATSYRRTLITGGIIFLIAALVAIYLEVMTTHTIAPPSLRILDFFWRSFTG